MFGLKNSNVNKNMQPRILKDTKQTTKATEKLGFKNPEANKQKLNVIVLVVEYDESSSYLSFYIFQNEILN